MVKDWEKGYFYIIRLPEIYQKQLKKKHRKNDEKKKQTLVKRENSPSLTSFNISQSLENK